MIVVDAQGLAASRPNRPLFRDVSLTVSTGDRVGVVGINGCGKSTLLAMLAGRRTPEAGEVRHGRGVRIGFLGQQPELASGTVAQAVGHGWQGAAMLDRLGMAAVADRSTSELSGGQAKRASLAALLCGEYDGLILDEPTNHLDLDAIGFLEAWLAAYRGAVVLVTHDRHVLDRLTTKVLEIDRGAAYVHVPSGVDGGSGYAAYLAGRAAREARAETAEQVRRNLAARELAWLRRGAPARTSKPKARIAAATAIVQGRAQAAARDGELRLAMGTTRLGNQGVELQAARFAWPDGAPVLDPTTVTFEPGDRIGVVGPNGAGKSTLLDLVAGRLTPTAGAVRRGSTVRIGYYDQLGRDLDLAARVRDVVAGDKGQPSIEDVTLMRRFWFDGDAQFAPIGTLSGGERRRLQLLLVLLEQPNVLLLDEPTNDLDLDTLRALEDFLESWPGIVVAASHDRAFLDRVTDEILLVDGTGGVRWIRGGVAGWLAERAAAASAPAAAPAAGRAAPERSARATGAGPARSPSTLRRLLGQAERAMNDAARRRDELVAALAGASGADAHQIGGALAAAQDTLEAAEADWLALAEEAG